MAQKRWSISIKLFNNISGSVLIGEHFNNTFTDSQRVLSVIGKVFSKYLKDEFSQKIISNTQLQNKNYSSLDELRLELAFTQDNQQKALRFDDEDNNFINNIEAVLEEASKIVDEIYQINPDYPEHITVSSKASQNGIQTKSILCAELVNRLRRTNIKIDTLTFEFPSQKKIDMHLKRVQNHSTKPGEKKLALTGTIVEFSDLDHVIKLRENGTPRQTYKILFESLPIEDRNNLLDYYKSRDLVTFNVMPSIKLISGIEEVNDYMFIDYLVAQQKIT